VHILGHVRRRYLRRNYQGKRFPARSTRAEDSGHALSLIVAPGESLLGANGFFGIGNVLSELGVSTAVGVGWGVVAAVAGCAAIWGIARDIPLRPKVA